jgi:hypothetical protein
LRKAEDSRHSAFDRLGYVACGQNTPVAIVPGHLSDEDFDAMS